MNINELFIETNLPEPLSTDELYNCFEKMKQGDMEAREKIINHHIKFVKDLVIRHYSNTPYDLKELVSVGLKSLVDSVDKFDINSKLYFSTYLANYINREIQKFMNEEKKYIDVISLNQTIVTDKEGKSLKVRDTLNDIVTAYENNETYKVIRKVIEELSERDKYVAMKYFGLIDNKLMTQQELADEFGCSRSNVAFIIENIRKKIKFELKRLGIIEWTDESKTINKKKLKDKNISKRLKTIYELFNDYTKEQVDDMLSILNEEEKALITLRYGEDLDNPTISKEWNKEKYYEYYLKLVPKMKRLLANPNTSKMKRLLANPNTSKMKRLLANPNTLKRLKTIYEYFSKYTKEQVDDMLSILNEEEKALITLRYGEDLDNPTTTKEWNKEKCYEYYLKLVPKMKRLLANPNTLKRLKTIYEYFSKYTKEQVDEMLSKLNEEEKALITLRYGEDLDNPTTSKEWNREKNNQYYNVLIPKMKKLLVNPNYVFRAKRNKIVKENIVSKSPITVNIPDSKLINKTQFEQFKEPISEPILDEKAMVKEDYIELLELLKASSFNQTLSTLTKEDIKIVKLKFGCVDGKYFTTDEIAEFLEITPNEVRKITKKFLMLYKTNINVLIDKAVEFVTNEQNQNVLIKEKNKNTNTK